MLSFAVLLISAYLIGAFPSSVVLGRAFRGIDVRQHGSGNAGATNAWRVLGRNIGIAVLVLDVAKGSIAVALLPRLAWQPLPLALSTAALVLGATAVIGHVFPVYIGFRGGKGVATAAGVLVALAPIPCLIGLGAFGLAVIASGWVSLGSLFGAWAVPLATVLHLGTAPFSTGFIALTVVIALFITYTHRGNIRRLLSGTERRFPNLQVWKRIVRRQP